MSDLITPPLFDITDNEAAILKEVRERIAVNSPGICLELVTVPGHEDKRKVRIFEIELGNKITEALFPSYSLIGFLIRNDIVADSEGLFCEEEYEYRIAWIDAILQKHELDNPNYWKEPTFYSFDKFYTVGRSPKPQKLIGYARQHDQLHGDFIGWQAKFRKIKGGSISVVEVGSDQVKEYEEREKQ